MRTNACRGVGSVAARSRRRQYKLLESLESRLLLSVSYTDADFSGTWDLVGCRSGGTVVANGGGGFTGGAVRVSGDSYGNVTGGSYTIESTGEISGGVVVGGTNYDFWGAVGTTKDVICLYAAAIDDSQVLIKHTVGTFTNADAAGTWSFTSFTIDGDTGHGTMTFDALGHITSLTGTSSEGGSFRVTGATYSVASNGTVTVNAPGEGGVLTFAGAMNNGKDFVGLSATSLQAAIDSENPAAIYMEKTSDRAYSNADLAGTYFVTDTMTYEWSDEGSICFDGLGHIVGGESDMYSGITGTYSVSPTGQVTIKATLDYFGDMEIHQLAGALNASNSIATLSGRVTYQGTTWSPDSELWTIVPNNRAPTLGSFDNMGPAVAGQPYTITYDELLEHSDAEDADDDDVRFEFAAVGNGTVDIGSVDGKVGPGDTLTWTPAAGASGLTTMYFVATDGIDHAYSLVPLKIATAAKPTVSVAATKNSASETHTATSGLGVFTFTRIGGDLSSPLTVTYSVGGSATNGDDYDAIGTTVTFAAGEKSKTLTITPVNDTLGESVETALLSLETSDAYALGSKRSGTVTIASDEPIVSVVATKSILSEAKPATAGAFTFTRTGGDLSQTLTVSFAHSGGATDSEDFAGFPSSITFFANEKTKTLNVTVIDDTTADAGESLILTLEPAANYGILAAKSSAAITILDNEPLVSVAVAKGGASESATGKPGVFTFTRTGDLSQQMLVHYTVGGSAFSGPDYNPLPGQVVIPANQRSATVEVVPLDDGKADAGHDVVLTVVPDDVSPTYSADPAKSSGCCVIADDEPVVSVTASKNTAAESGAKTLGQFTITRADTDLGPSLVVHFQITGTAQNGVDYSALGDTVTFAPFEKSITINVTPMVDWQAEGSEDVTLTLVPDSPVLPTYAICTGKASARVSIADHNRPVEFGSPDYVEGNTFTFSDLVTALAVSDPESAPITLVVTKVSDGIFAKNGTLVTTGTTISAGDVLVWYPKSYLSTSLVSALSLSVSDGANKSPAKTLQIDSWG